MNAPDKGPEIAARSAPPFRADHVGSFLRPRYLLDAREKRKNGEIDAEQIGRASCRERV